MKVRALVCLEETVEFEGHRRQQRYSTPVPVQSSLADYLN